MFIIQPNHCLPPRSSRMRGLTLALLCLAPFLVGLLALALGQDANWDLRNYHFYNAFAFLHQRYDRDLLPSQIPFFYNPLIDVPFYLLATHVPARVAGFALGWVQGLNFVLLFMLAHAALRIANPRQKMAVSFALATLGLLGGGGIAQIGTTFGDNMISIGFLLSAVLAVRHMDRLLTLVPARAFALVYLFGLPAGMMMGLKLPGVIYGVGLCGGFLFAGGPWWRRLLLSFGFGLGILTGMALTEGYWAVYLARHYQNPFFPYFNNLFKSPFEPPVSERDFAYVPHNPRDWFIIPFVFAIHPFRVGEIAWRDWRIPILYVLLPLTVVVRLFFGRNRAAHDAVAAPDVTRYLLGGFALAYFAWLAMFTIYRYAVLLEMVTPLLLVLTVGLLPLRLATRALIAAFILAVVSASIVPGNWHRRATWLDHFVETDVPPLADPAHLMILMAGFEPYSHLLPLFPPQAFFVRIQSNFASPNEDKGINRLIHDRVDAHRRAGGRFMLLIPPWQYPLAQDALAYYDLRLHTDQCQTLSDRLFDDKPMSLCTVTSTATATGTPP